MITTRPHHLLIVLLLVLTMVGGSALAQGIPLIRDAEIEEGLRTLATPVFKAAGIPPDRVQLVLVNDDDLNAFVAAGQNIFIHTGLIMATETPEQLLGVLAHETGHIAAGHLVRGSEAIARSGVVAAASTLLGLIAAAASGQPDAAIAVIASGQQLATSSFLSSSRSLESQADQAALTFLEEAGISPKGLLEFFETLGDQELLPASQQVEYARTHPLTADRIETIRAALEVAPHANNQLGPEALDAHARMKAKLIGYLRPARETLRRYPPTDTSLYARYARAIALFRSGQVAEAEVAFDSLIAEEPANAYFIELKAQMLLENARVAESVPLYRKAVLLAPEADLIRTALAHALIELGDDTVLPEAISNLQAAVRKEKTSPQLHRWLSIAYGRSGDTGRAELHLAEEALLQGRYEDARRKALVARETIEQGSPSWFQAQDILAMLETVPVRRNR